MLTEIGVRQYSINNTCKAVFFIISSVSLFDLSIFIFGWEELQQLIYVMHHSMHTRAIHENKLNVDSIL